MTDDIIAGEGGAQPPPGPPPAPGWTPPPKKPSGIGEWVRIRPWPSVVIALVIGIAVGFGAGSEADEVTPASTTAESDSAGESEPTPPEEEDAPAEPEAEPEPEPEADPDATFTQTCDYLLGSGLNDNEFYGQSKVVNTGNVDITVKVTFLWGQAGTAPVKIVKEVDVPYSSKKVVNARTPADYTNISRLQSLPYEDQCKVRAAVTDYSGSPH